MVDPAYKLLCARHFLIFLGAQNFTQSKRPKDAKKRPHQGAPGELATNIRVVGPIIPSEKSCEVHSQSALMQAGCCLEFWIC